MKMQWIRVSSRTSFIGNNLKCPTVATNEINSCQEWTMYTVKVKSPRHVRLFATPRTVACQAPLSMGFSRQEYWSGLPFPSPGDLPDPGIKPGSPALRADALPSEAPGKLGSMCILILNDISVYLHGKL